MADGNVASTREGRIMAVRFRASILGNLVLRIKREKIVSDPAMKTREPFEGEWRDAKVEDGVDVLEFFNTNQAIGGDAANMIFAIDPGTTESAFVLLDEVTAKIVEAGKITNHEMLDLIREGRGDRMVVEMVQSFGMPVGKQVFETVRWIGRFQQTWRMPDDVAFVYRSDIKHYLCGQTKGVNDAVIRQRLIDLFGAPGTKKSQGATYGLKADQWSALAVAVTFAKL